MEDSEFKDEGADNNTKTENQDDPNDEP